MFTRSFIGNPFQLQPVQLQPATFGAFPLPSVSGISPFSPQGIGYNPFLSFLTPQVSTIVALSTFNPVLPQIVQYGVNPVLPQIGQYGVNPVLPQIGQYGVNPVLPQIGQYGVNPYQAA